MTTTGTAAARPPRLALELALLALLALLMGSSYPLIKIGLQSIPPMTLIAVRVSIAAALLSALCLQRGAGLPRDIHTWRMFLVQACCNSIVPWTILAWAQQHIDSALAGVLNSTAPLWVFAATVLWTRHEPVTPRRLCGALLGFGGVILVLGTDALDGLGANVLAQAAALGGAVLYGAAAIYGRRFSHLPPLVTAAGSMIVATATLVPAALVLERPWTVVPSAPSAAAVATLAVLCTAGALLLYFRLVRTLGSMGVASQAYLRSGVSVLLGVFVLGEQVTTPVALGLLATIAGVAAINLPSRR